MKYAFGVIALALASTAALADDQVFQGDVFFTTATIQSAACANAGFHQYDYMRMTIRPASAVNGPNTQANLYGPRYASHFHINNHALSGSGTYSGTGFSSKGAVFNWTAAFSGALTTPATITNATQSIAVKFTLSNFLNNPGCTGTMAGTLGLRPDL